MFNGVKGLDHIGIPTVDMEASAKFYEELGFERVGEFPLGERKFLFYQADTIIVELIPAKEIVGAEGAVGHFAVSCDSAEEAYAFCKEKGYTILGDKINQLNFWENGIKCFNILGPNKEKIEFVEVL